MLGVNHNTLSGGQFYMFKGNSRFISIMLCALLCLQTLPMEVFASQQVSENSLIPIESVSNPVIAVEGIIPPKSMYQTLQELETQESYLPNIGQSYTNNELSDDASFAFAKMVFSCLYKPLENTEFEYGMEEHSTLVAELKNQSFVKVEIISLMQQAKMGDMIKAQGANKETHYMIFLKATANSVLVYDCDFTKDSDDYIREHYIDYDQWLEMFGQPNAQGENLIQLYHANNYDALYGMSDTGLVDDSINFNIENGVLKSYSGNQAIVRIPDTVTSVAVRAFHNNKSVRSYVFPSSSLEVGRESFIRGKVYNVGQSVNTDQPVERYILGKFAIENGQLVAREGNYWMPTSPLSKYEYAEKQDISRAGSSGLTPVASRATLRPGNFAGVNYNIEGATDRLALDISKLSPQAAFMQEGLV